jgi:hypothetical protein
MAQVNATLGATTINWYRIKECREEHILQSFKNESLRGYSHVNSIFFKYKYVLQLGHLPGAEWKNIWNAFRARGTATFTYNNTELVSPPVGQVYFVEITSQKQRAAGHTSEVMYFDVELTLTELGSYYIP